MPLFWESLSKELPPQPLIKTESGSVRFLAECLASPRPLHWAPPDVRVSLDSTVTGDPPACTELLSRKDGLSQDLELRSSGTRRWELLPVNDRGLERRLVA